MEAVYIDHMGSDLRVVQAARVSFADMSPEERDMARNEGLLKYLARHNHWTPFAHTTITLRMKAPIPVRTQCFKHKFGFVENEESRRYVSYEPEYFEPVWRKASDNKKQGSGDEVNTESSLWANDRYKYAMELALNIYQQLLDAGICEEQARFVLPQGCMVNWYWTGSLAAFARFYNQRTDPHAQKEIQDLAKMVGDIIEPLFPVSWRELTKCK